MPLIAFWARLLLLAAFCHVAQAADSVQGYVLASLPGAEPADTLVLESVNDKAKYRLAKLASRGGHTLGIALPAGDYRLHKWRDGFMPPYPTITVMAGRLTDMGSLVPVPVGNNDMVLLPLHNAETARNAQAAAAELQSLQSRAPLPWRVERVPAPSQVVLDPGQRFGLIPYLLKYYEARANAAPIGKRLREVVSVDEFAALAKLATPPLTQKLVMDAQGRSYFGAALGQIRVRDANGTWSALDTGSLHTITAVAASAGQLLAGFENGMVRSSSDGGATWKAAAALDPSVAVVDISRLGDQWLITTARGLVLRSGLRSVDQMVVHAARAADLSDLAKLREFPVETEPLVRPGAASFGNYFYVNAYPKLWRLDLATQQWQSVGPDTDVSGFQVAPGNGTLAAYRIRGAFSKLYVSTDHGGSWRKADNPPYVIMDIRFTDADNGQAVRWNTGAFSGVIELLQYDRTKDSWTKAVDAPVGCVAALPDASHRARFCVARGGNILSLADGKWTAEFAVD